MRQLQELPIASARAVHTVFSDIDDTLTTHGMLTSEVIAALEHLRAKGLRVVLTTGRPAGWCDHIARMWPVDAVVGENGAFYYWYDRTHRKLNARHLLSEAQRNTNALKLQEVKARVLAEVPGCAVASDQFCRLYDLAIDFCEDVPALPEAAVRRIVQLMEEAGMTAKVSSIHVNGWFGTYDKLTMAAMLMSEQYGLDLDAERERCVYAGDSPNDAPMFAYMPISVGVANVAQYLNQMPALPQYVTPSAYGKGFGELAAYLASSR
jgi:HAD superfamily hydrolase (TIGR01484 family)